MLEGRHYVLLGEDGKPWPDVWFEIEAAGEVRGKNGCSGYEGRIDWTQTGSIGDGVDIDDGPVNANAGTNPRTYPFAFGHLAVNGTSDNGQLSLTLTLSDAYGGPTYPAGTEIHVLSTG